MSAVLARSKAGAGERESYAVLRRDWIAAKSTTTVSESRYI